jgi:integrase
MNTILNADLIETFVPTSNDEFIWDGKLEGFGLRVRRGKSSLTHTWVAQYKTRTEGRTRRHTLGGLDRLTPEEAREAARTILAQATLGGDPQAELQAKRAESGRTLRKAIETYLNDPAIKGLRSIRHKRLYLLGSYWAPLHNRGLSQITLPDVAQQLTALRQEHSEVTARAARIALSAFFKWAKEEGWVTSDPVRDTRVPENSKSRDRVLTKGELVAVWNAAGTDVKFPGKRADAKARNFRKYGQVVRLLMLTGARREEVAGMRHSELDLEAGTWTIARDRSKNGEQHRVSLSPPAIAIIREAMSNALDDLVFGGVHWKFKTDLDKASGVTDWVLHDLRRTMATIMADNDIEPHHIEAVLNHVGHKAGVAGIYNRAKYEPQKADAWRRWSDLLIKHIESRNVIQLHAA